MNATWNVELFVYLITALSALLLLPRSANWRLRLVIGTTGLQALAHAASEMKKHDPFWQERLGSMTGIVELFGGALALTAIYLLKQENKERKSTDALLRLSEAVEAGAPAPAATKPAAAEESAAEASPLPTGSESGEPSPAGPAPTGRKQRKTRRYTVSMLAKVTRLDGERRVFQGKLVDISQGGARLSLPESLPAGALVRIEAQDQLYLGEVCSCEEWQGRYEAGIRFAHSLDLPELSRVLRGPGADPAADEKMRQMV